MSYFTHFRINIKIAGKAFLLFLFHFIHAVIPISITSHEYWGIKLTKSEMNNEYSGDKPRGPFPLEPL